MNLTGIYNEIETRLKGAESFKLVTWYNRQDVDGIVHTVPAVFIEFPEPMRTETLQGQHQQALLTVRVHLVSKIVSRKDGSINNDTVAAHEALVDDIYNSLHERSIVIDEDKHTTALERTALQLYMGIPGWAITRQDFQCMAYQHPVTTGIIIPTPPPDIDTEP